MSPETATMTNPDLTVIEIPPFLGQSKDNLVLRQVKHAIGIMFLYAHNNNIHTNQICVMTDVDGVLRRPADNIFTPGRIEEQVLDQLSVLENSFGVRICQITTNNITNGFVARSIGAVAGYNIQDTIFHNNLPGTQITSARYVGERPKQQENVIQKIAQDMTIEIKRGSGKLLAMFGDNPKDIEFFNRVVQEIKEQNPNLLEDVRLLFIKFPYTIPSFVPQKLHGLWKTYT